MAKKGSEVKSERKPSAEPVQCRHCEKPALPDPRGIHACARCRKEKIEK